MWIHVCTLVVGIEESSTYTLYKKLPHVLQVLDPACCMPSSLQRLIQRARGRLTLQNGQSFEDRFNMCVKECQPKKVIVSDELEAMGVTVDWLLNETETHPKAPLQLTNAHAHALYIFRNSRQATCSYHDLKDWILRLTGKEIPEGSLFNSLQALRDKKRKYVGNKKRHETFLKTQYELPAPRSSGEANPHYPVAVSKSEKNQQEEECPQLQKATEELQKTKNRLKMAHLCKKNILKREKSAKEREAHLKIELKLKEAKCSSLEKQINLMNETCNDKVQEAVTKAKAQVEVMIAYMYVHNHMQFFWTA